MGKRYIYPQNLRTEPRLWLWNLRDAALGGAALAGSAVLWARGGPALPAALSLAYAFLSVRTDDCSVLDHIRRAFRYFVGSQQRFLWREGRHDG